MASAEREPITWVWGVRGMKLNAFLFLSFQRKLQICPIIDIRKSQKITQ